jgi:CPA2 family monovalent cation:H+ antiporter-2
MHEIAPMIRDLAVMLGIASVVVLLFQKIRQPVILGYIIAGVIVGPYTPPYSFVDDINQIQTLSELGVIFLMFTLGLDFSFHKLKRIGFSATITGTVKFAIVLIVGIVAGWFMNWSFYDRVFLGGALAISSTMIIVKALEELNLKGKRFTDIVFGILIFEDLLAILMLTTLSTVVVTKHFFSLDMIIATVKLIVVVGGWFLSGYFLVPILFKSIVKYVSQETLTVVSIGLCLGMAVLSAYLSYSMALGAFIIGSILSETPLVNRIKQLTSPLRDVFVAVFFISVGMLINIQVILEHWMLIIVISAVTVFGKIFATTVGTFLTGQSPNTSIKVGFSMVPIGEFSFIIVALGLKLHVTSNSLYQMVVGISAITTFIAPYLIKLSGGIADRLDEKISDRTKYFLDTYSSWVYRALASYKKQVGYRKFMMRLVFNGAVVGLIFTLTNNYISPQLEYIIVNEDAVHILSWLIALTASAPFIWGMLFGFKLIDKSGRMPALVLSIAITIFEIIVLSVAYFSTWYVPLVIAVIMFVIFGLSYRQLGRSYEWVEKHFLRMLRRKSQIQDQFEDLAPWDTHLVEVTVNNDSPDSVVGKTLYENQIRRKYGINVVAVHRGSQVILAPRGDEKVMLHDKLVVLGNDEQIDAFKSNAESNNHDAKKEDILKNFILKPIVLEEGNPLIGMSIRDSNIREHVHGLVVGLERKGVRILNPDPATVLKINDLLLVVADTEAMLEENRGQVHMYRP